MFFLLWMQHPLYLCNPDPATLSPSNPSRADIIRTVSLLAQTPACPLRTNGKGLGEAAAAKSQVPGLAARVDLG